MIIALKGEYLRMDDVYIKTRSITAVHPQFVSVDPSGVIIRTINYVFRFPDAKVEDVMNALSERRDRAIPTPAPPWWRSPQHH